MAEPPSSSNTAAFLFLAFLLFSVAAVAAEGPRTYIVHVSPSHKPAAFASHRHWYASTLAGLAGLAAPSVPASRILYTYERAAAGFAARLTPSQADALRRLPAVLAVEPDRARHLHTTRTPAFLGLTDGFGLWPNSHYADDVVVGVLDTGIWPERASFSDEGLSPVPSYWRGACEVADDFPASACNRKLVGARSFYRGYEAARGSPINETLESKSPRDTEGHGTHTSSTAAGAAVTGAALFGYAAGEARGMATKARIAAYKICWSLGCFDSDILAAMDSAVTDGVDIISLSVGANGYAPSYYRDSIAIGAFGAVQHGVLVSCSAGNSGPGAYTAVNIAPWILTVGASTIDREFPADAVLGDGSSHHGVSLYSGDPLGQRSLPLVYAGDCGSALCLSGSLDPEKVAGKLVLCDRGVNARVEKGSAVKLAGGAGMILANTAESGEELVADAHLVPATMVGQIAGDKIRNYTKTSPTPTGTIHFRGTVTGPFPAAPRVAAFSARGPNIRTLEILKPDVIAPGVNILAAWTGSASPTDLDIDPRRVDFNIISGTSMSCPHASGLAALLRNAHPDWSPAAIKSALMTTAYNTDNSGGAIGDLANGGDSTPFARGAGHADPNRALDPGLVYDIHIDDYVSFLCTIGYSPLQIAVFVKDLTVDCSGKKMASPGNLNYPSFSVAFDPQNKGVTYTRSVTNVGGGQTGEVAYEVEVSPPAGVEIAVNPSKLVFGEQNQTLSYSVTFSTLVEPAQASPLQAFGWIAWKDGAHVVRSPVAFHWSAVGLVSSM